MILWCQAWVEGKYGCFCILRSLFAAEASRRALSPAFLFALTEREDRPLLMDLQAYSSAVDGSASPDLIEPTSTRFARWTGCRHIVLPAFRTFPLVREQGEELSGFSLVCQMIGQGDHLERHGLEK